MHAPFRRECQGWQCYDVPEREEAMLDPCHAGGPVKFEKKVAKIEGESPLATPSDSLLAFAVGENDEKSAKAVRDEGSEHSLNMDFLFYSGL